MRDTELYRHLLALTAPWTVERVELEVKSQRVELWATPPGETRRLGRFGLTGLLRGVGWC